MIGPDELRELLHAQAASIEPVPHLAELGAALTTVERQRHHRVLLGTTVAAVAVAAAAVAVRTLETRPTRFDTAPATATRRLPAAAATVTTPTTVAALPATTVPATAPAVAPAGAPHTTATPPATAAPATTASPPATATPAGPHVLTFRAASVSDLSSANPPAVDYFGVAPPGTTVTATSAYGTASTQAGADSNWSMHLVLPNAPVGQRVKVVLSAPPLPSLTFTFTHTAG